VSPLSGLFFEYSIGAYDLGLLARCVGFQGTSSENRNALSRRPATREMRATAPDVLGVAITDLRRVLGAEGVELGPKGAELVGR
jgi:hypothetical protein